MTRARMWNRGTRGSWALAACLTVHASMGAGCGRKPAQETGPPPAQEVGVITAVSGKAPMVYEFVAQTEASKTVEIRARVQGFLLTRAFTEGGQVSEGDVLFRIDPRSFEADLEIARARLEQAQARQALAESTISRLEQVASLGAANPKEMDEAEAELLNSKAAVRLAGGDVANAELNLSYTVIRSPLSGKIGRSLKDEGSLVDAGANSLLATVTQVDPIYVYFSISEREVLRWKQDRDTGRITGPSEGNVPVSVTLTDGTEHPQQGLINFVDVRTDPQTGTSTVRAALPNPDEKLQPGQFVKAKILGWERVNAVTIPQRAIMQGPMGASVWVIGEGDKAELRPVRLGPWYAAGWIVEQGLRPGERVVADGVQRVRPGAVVRPTLAGSAPAQTNPAANSAAPGK